MLRAILLALLTLSLHADPQITTLAGTGAPGFSGDNAPASQAQLDNPFGLTRGPDGALYFCDTGNHAIRRIDKNNVITTIAGTPTKKGYAGDNGPANKALMNEPYELRFDKQGDLFVVERLNHCIRKIDIKTNTISTLAGNGKPGFAGDNGPAAKAQFNQPHSLQFDKQGDLYICDILNHRIRKIEMSTGQISTFAGTGKKEKTPDGAKLDGVPLLGPRALDFDASGDCYLALREGNAVFKIDMNTRTLHHIAGNGRTGLAGNGGPARSAALSGPKGLAIHPATGNIYLADTESNTIRMINIKTSTIHLIAGTGQKGDGPDGNPLQCQLARPHGIYIDSNATLYIGDSESHKIRTLPLPQ
jgi:DNA-binding beta-propeller fold protein YncE